MGSSAEPELDVVKAKASMHASMVEEHQLFRRGHQVACGTHTEVPLSRLTSSLDNVEAGKDEHEGTHLALHK